MVNPVAPNAQSGQGQALPQSAADENQVIGVENLNNLQRLLESS